MADLINLMWNFYSTELFALEAIFLLIHISFWRVLFLKNPKMRMSGTELCVRTHITEPPCKYICPLSWGGTETGNGNQSRTIASAWVANVLEFSLRDLFVFFFNHGFFVQFFYNLLIRCTVQLCFLFKLETISVKYRKDLKSFCLKFGFKSFLFLSWAPIEFHRFIKLNSLKPIDPVGIPKTLMFLGKGVKNVA